ncbi:mediator of RNA polymerase II transcription subunit 34-like protein, partial [Trifolium pratense]
VRRLKLEVFYGRDLTHWKRQVFIHVCFACQSAAWTLHNMIAGRFKHARRRRKNTVKLEVSTEGKTRASVRLKRGLGSSGLELKLDELRK